jgi:hypothetical protein
VLFTSGTKYTNLASGRGEKMYKMILIVILILACSTQVYAHGYGLPSPLDNLCYSDCPTAVQVPATVGKWVFMPPLAMFGALGGLLYGAVTLDVAEGVMIGGFAGVMTGNFIGTGLFGAPGYGIYRLFNWDGCTSKGGE